MNAYADRLAMAEEAVMDARHVIASIAKERDEARAALSEARRVCGEIYDKWTRSRFATIGIEHELGQRLRAIADGERGRGT